MLPITAEDLETGAIAFAEKYLTIPLTPTVCILTKGCHDIVAVSKQNAAQRQQTIVGYFANAIAVQIRIQLAIQTGHTFYVGLPNQPLSSPNFSIGFTTLESWFWQALCTLNHIMHLQQNNQILYQSAPHTQHCTPITF